MGEDHGEGPWGRAMGKGQVKGQGEGPWGRVMGEDYGEGPWGRTMGKGQGNGPGEGPGDGPGEGPGEGHEKGQGETEGEAPLGGPFILSPMCKFVCEVPAGSTCLIFLSVRISVFDSTGGLNVHPRSDTNNNKDLI